MTPSKRLSHVKPDGSVTMVDVGKKPVTDRIAFAEAFVDMKPQALDLLKRGAAKKGDVLAAAQIAGIFAAKKTAQLIPLCHPVLLANIEVKCDVVGNSRVRIKCKASCSGQTGVEMEALVGAAVAALTVYDMCKAADREMTINNVRLVEKSGGRSGRFRRKNFDQR